jgi:ankyrin repeat protein
MANSSLIVKLTQQTKIWTKVKKYIKSQSPADVEPIDEITSLVPQNITITSEKLLHNLRTQPLQMLIELEAPIEVITDVISEKNINKKSDKELTPLHFAIRRKRWEIVPTFYQRGADTNAKVSIPPKTLYTILFDSIRYYAPDQIIRKLISPENINMQSGSGSTALHMATFLAYWAISPDLLEAGADVNLVNERNETALHIACKHDFCHPIPMSIFTQLISPHNINLPDKDGDTPLHIAALHTGVMFIPTLLEHGADINVRGSRNRTALHFAIGSYHSIDDDDIISLLISPTNINVLSTNITLLGPRKRSTLEVAIYRKLHSAALLLLKRGADPSTVIEFRTELSLSELCFASIRRAMRVISDETLSTLPLPRQIIEQMSTNSIIGHFDQYLKALPENSKEWIYEELHGEPNDFANLLL